MIIVFIILGILLLIVILLLPTSIVNKLSGVGVAIGLLFTGYGLYMTSQVQKREIFEKDISRVTDVWTKYYSSILNNESTWDVFGEIHGNVIPVPEHIMFSQIAQFAEEIARREDIGLPPVDKTWKSTLVKWVKHPDWPTFWAESKDEYTESGRRLIESLMRQHA